MAEFTTLMSGLSFTDCPRWRDGRLYVSDFYAHRVLAVAMDGMAETLAHVPQQPSLPRSCPGRKTARWPDGQVISLGNQVAQ
jgi:hypothetical protein